MKEQLLERFYRYTAIASQSKSQAGVVPSSEGQRQLAQLLRGEMEAIGFTEVKINAYSVLTGRLSARLPQGCGKKIPVVGFVAHLDTVNVNLRPEIKPQLVENYQGGDVCLNAAERIVLRGARDPVQRWNECARRG